MKGTQEWVAKALSDIAFTLTSSDELNLPKLIENDIVIQLAPSLMKRYKRLEDKSTIDFSDVTLSANSASALSMKVRQFTQGFMYDDDGVSRGIHQEKYEALKSIIENNEGDNILCPVQFIEDIKFLQRMIPGTPAIYSGTSDKDTARYLEQWNKGEIPLLLIHPASVSHGLNLQSGGHTIIWYALTWDLDHYEQVIARLLRSGQIAKSVVVHHLICKDTIDELIIQAIRRKAKVQDKTLNTMEVLQNGKEKAYAN
jgi:SNF2 family DNA or RNA helicase